MNMSQTFEGTHDHLVHKEIRPVIFRNSGRKFLADKQMRSFKRYRLTRINEAGGYSSNSLLPGMLPHRLGVNIDIPRKIKASFDRRVNFNLGLNRDQLKSPPYRI
jgi:hypothetical protein